MGHKQTHLNRKNNLLQHIKSKHTFQQSLSITDKIIPSFQTLPVELVYRILDQMDDFTMLYSMRDVCGRINRIVDTYHRYQVNFALF